VLPFGVSKIAGITQLRAIVFRAVLARPYWQPLPSQAAFLESHLIHTIQLLFGRTLRDALAHRIPLFIPPHCVRDANDATYMALKRTNFDNISKQETARR
jgi:hypothetical protein